MNSLYFLFSIIMKKHLLKIYFAASITLLTSLIKTGTYLDYADGKGCSNGCELTQFGFPLKFVWESSLVNDKPIALFVIFLNFLIYLVISYFIFKVVDIFRKK